MPIHCQPLSFVFLKVETAYSMSDLAPKSSGSLAMFAAMRLASSHISTPAMSGLSREAGPLAGSSHKVLIYQRVISSPKPISPTPQIACRAIFCSRRPKPTPIPLCRSKGVAPSKRTL
jgi:hypothetical protein